ncbi:hypothetical protein TNCV_1036541 [Trichonephila clavipes]|nr:hypothetical protein TNCV_1036541 [Trichonephila clavipes]
MTNEILGKEPEEAGSVIKKLGLQKLHKSRSKKTEAEIDIEFSTTEKTILRKRVGVTSYTQTFGDGPRNFEPWSNDEDETGAGYLSPNYHTSPNGGRLCSRQI